MARVTISLPRELFARLDRMVRDRGYANRSQAIAEMVGANWITHAEADDDHVMAGAIAMVYDQNKRNLATRLLAIQRRHAAVVVSAQRSLVGDHHALEVILVQGRAPLLRRLADKLASCKGVSRCELVLGAQLGPERGGRT